MEYTISPPGASILKAVFISFFCSFADSKIFLSSHIFLKNLASFLENPSLEHGASRSILSNCCVKSWSSFVPSFCRVIVFIVPILFRFATSFLLRLLLGSLAISSPWLFIISDRSVVFDPGAAQMSRTLSSGFGESMNGGRRELRDAM